MADESAVRQRTSKVIERKPRLTTRHVQLIALRDVSLITVNPMEVFQWTGIAWKEIGNRRRARSRRSGVNLPMMTLLLSTVAAINSKAKFRSATALPRIRFGR